MIFPVSHTPFYTAKDRGPSQMLLGSGATSNFISDAMVTALKLLVQPYEGF